MSSLIEGSLSASEEDPRCAVALEANRVSHTDPDKRQQNGPPLYSAQAEFFRAQLNAFDESNASFAFAVAVANALLALRANDMDARDCGYATSNNRVQRGNDEGQNARLFAFVNAAMGDAGILAWQHKYCHDFWRPVVGIREHDDTLGPTAPYTANVSFSDADPGLASPGAPSTNSNGLKNFTPNFPAYPSGHATFGAAAFHITRMFSPHPPLSGRAVADDSRERHQPRSSRRALEPGAADDLERRRSSADRHAAGEFGDAHRAEAAGKRRRMREHIARRRIRRRGRGDGLEQERKGKGKKAERRRESAHRGDSRAGAGTVAGRTLRAGPGTSQHAESKRVAGRNLREVIGFGIRLEADHRAVARLTPRFTGRLRIMPRRRGPGSTP